MMLGDARRANVGCEVLPKKVPDVNPDRSGLCCFVLNRLSRSTRGGSTAKQREHEERLPVRGGCHSELVLTFVSPTFAPTPPVQWSI